MKFNVNLKPGTLHIEKAINQDNIFHLVIEQYQNGSVYLYNHC